MGGIEPSITFDVFLSHASPDKDIVEAIGARLIDDAQLKVWFDRWSLVPGQKWQQELLKGLDEARTCAIFLGSNTPSGWFKEEIDYALARQIERQDFRVIPGLLLGADSSILGFLKTRTWVDFSNGVGDAYAFHRLKCGICGVPPGHASGEDRLPKSGGR